MARVFKFKEIKVFKVLFVIGGEFPVVKAIGYRRLLCKVPVDLSYPQYQTVMKSFKRFSGYDALLPIKSEKIPISGFSRIYKRSRRSSKYRKLTQYRKMARASYSRFRGLTPIISKGAGCAEQLGTLFLLESNSNLFRGAQEEAQEGGGVEEHSAGLTEAEASAEERTYPVFSARKFAEGALQLVQTECSVDLNYILNLLRLAASYDLFVGCSSRPESANSAGIVADALVDLAHLRNAATLVSSGGFGKFLLMNV